MGKVVGFAQNEEIISVLRAWSKAAKEGRMTMLNAVVVIDDEIQTEICNTDESLLEALGMLHLLTSELTKEIQNED